MAETQPVRPLIDAVEDPLILIDGAEVAEANRAASALFDRDPRGAQIGELLPAAVLRALDASDPGTPGVVATIGPEKRQWEVRIGSVAPGQRLVHLIDRTAIEAIERMRVDFVANASHELRTPIAAISGFAETLADDEAAADPETRQRFVAIIAREIHRMQRLVEDLMSLSRIESERHVAPAAFADFAEVARTAAMAAAEQRPARGVDLVLTGLNEPAVVRGDAAQLAQIVHNLVSNGFKYGEPGTPVTVSIERRDGLAVLSVEDEGEGIPAKHLPRVTQRFYRVNATRSRAVGGTGLGLAIVKHIVERHGGTLRIESEPGRGTRVSVALEASHETVTDCGEGTVAAEVRLDGAARSDS